MDAILGLINAGVKAVKLVNPTGFAVGCEAGEVACEVGAVVLNRIKDGDISEKDWEDIKGEFFSELPEGTVKQAEGILAGLIKAALKL